MCNAKIRPFPTRSLIEVACEVNHDPALEVEGLEHRAILRDHAFAGSRTEITWFEQDRRTYRGDYLGPCTNALGCVLPAGHRGRCAA